MLRDALSRIEWALEGFECGDTSSTIAALADLRDDLVAAVQGDADREAA